MKYIDENGKEYEAIPAGLDYYKLEPVQPIESDPLREKVEIKLLWLTHGLSPNEEMQLIDCVMQLIKEGGSNG